MTVGALPDWAVAAFASPADIQLKLVYPLAQKLQGADVSLTKAIRDEAAKLSADQARARAGERPAVAAAEVVKRLVDAGSEATDAEPIVKFEATNGRTALSVLSSNRNGVSVRLHAGSGASEAELVAMFKSALKALEKQGRGLRS